MPLLRLVPTLPFLTTSPASSACDLAGLLRPAADLEVHSVSGSRVVPLRRLTGRSAVVTCPAWVWTTLAMKPGLKWSALLLPRGVLALRSLPLPGSRSRRHSDINWSSMPDSPRVTPLSPLIPVFEALRVSGADRPRNRASPIGSLDLRVLLHQRVRCLTPPCCHDDRPDAPLGFRALSFDADCSPPRLRTLQGLSGRRSLARSPFGRFPARSPPKWSPKSFFSTFPV